MLRNYIKTAFRNIWNHKGYSFLNLAGLSIGLAVCILLALWVKDELSYDTFHKNSDRIYRSMWDAKFGDNAWRIPQVPMPLAGMMEREFPEVEVATQAYEGGFTIKKGQEYVREQNVLFVDEKFFDVFSIQTIAGEAKSAIQNPNAVLVTEEMAEKYFDVKNDYQRVIGKSLQRNDGQLMQVAGVIESFPTQSHLQFGFLASLNNLTHLEQRRDQWNSASILTYFLMNEKGDPSNLDQKLQAYVDQNLANEEDAANGNYSNFPFEPIRDIHLKPNLSYIWIFGIIAAFILLLACINFINLATARAMMRAKEVGVRKVLGATRTQLIKQFFSESTLYVLLSVVFAIIIAKISLPFFNELADKELVMNWWSSPYIWMLLGGLILVTSFVTGAFPALALSSFSPSKVIKGEFLKVGGKDRFRQTMVVFQFCISYGLIIGTLIVTDQLQFLQNKDLGFDKEQVLVVERATALRDNYNAFIATIRDNAQVKDAAIAQYLPGDEFDSTIFIPEQPSNYEQTSLSYSHVSMNFVETLGLEIAAGRDYQIGMSTDSAAYLINEKAAERLGWADPIGRNLSFGGYQEGKVIGVVKDFNFASLHEDIEPLVMKVATWKMSNILIRLEQGNLKDQIAAIESEWNKFAPNAPFAFTFLDDEIQQLYESEQRMSSVFTIFAILAIFIACLGLFGLAAFMAERRTKEIGIRKVLGATVANIATALSIDFLKLVGLSLVIATPIAWYFMRNWLQNFAYQVDIQWRVFVFGGVVTVLIALLTVGFQSIKAALANPVTSLKNE